MGLKQSFIAVLLCACTMVGAQSATHSPWASQSSADSLYYEVDSAQLEQAMRSLRQQLGSVRSTKEQGQAQMLTALRYRLLMGLLSAPRPALGQKVMQGEPKAKETIAPQQSVANTQALERRIALLEQAVQSLLLAKPRAEQSQPIVLNAPNKGGSNPTTLNLSLQQSKQERTAPSLPTISDVDTAKVIPAARIEAIAQSLLTEDKASSISVPQTRVDTLHVVQVHRDTILVREPQGISRMVFFPVGTSRITAESKMTLSSVVQYLEHHPVERVRLVGYASPEGSLEVNLRLAKARTEAVRLYLISMGIAEERLEVAEGGLGNSSISPQLDRRVQLESIR